MFTFDSAILTDLTTQDLTGDAAAPCMVYVKHGNNPVRVQSDIASAPDNTWATWLHQWLNYYVFPSDFTISVDQDTWLWTSCQDPMMVDFFRLYAPDGSISFGADDHKGTCINTQADALEDVVLQNELSQLWHVDLCYETIRLDYGDKDVIMGWAGGNANSPYWFQDLDLQEEMNLLPSVEEIRDCERNKATSDQDCADLVGQILDFQITHTEMWEPVNSHGDMCNGDALAYCNSYGDLMDTYCDGEVCTTESQRNRCSRHYRLWGRQAIARGGRRAPSCGNQCGRTQLLSCTGFPCADLRESEDHHVMSYNSQGVATVEHFDADFAADGHQSWTCTSDNAAADSLVGTWSCPGFFSDLVTITEDYADDFTDASTDDAVDFCQDGQRIVEEREGLCNWDALAYCNSYSDLMAEYCGGFPCTNDEQRSGCTRHWTFIGRPEMRHGQRAAPTCPSWGRRALSTKTSKTGVAQRMQRLLSSMMA